MHDLTPLYDQYPRIIAQMPDVFTSHQFILRLAQQHQGLYIDALAAYQNEPDPFRIVHGRLSQGLRRFPELVSHVRDDAPSRDIFGNPNECAEWRRL